MHAAFSCFYHRVYAETLPRDGRLPALPPRPLWRSQRYASVIWPGDLDATLRPARRDGRRGRRRVHRGGGLAGLGHRGAEPRRRRASRSSARTPGATATRRRTRRCSRAGSSRRRSRRVMQIGTSSSKSPWEFSRGDRLRRRDARLVPHLHAAAPAALPVRVDLRAAHRERRPPDPAAARPGVSRARRAPDRRVPVRRRPAGRAGGGARRAPARRGVAARRTGSTGGRTRCYDGGRTIDGRCAARQAAAVPARGRHRADAASDHRHARADDRAGARRLVRDRPRRALSRAWRPATARSCSSMAARSARPPMCRA